jgi:glycosidase
LETHGSPRITEVTPGLEKPLLVLIATIPGIPMIQAGQEIGEQVRYGPALNIDWGKPDESLREFYKRVLEARASSKSLKYGTIKSVFKSGDEIIAFIRSYKEEEVLVVINLSDKETKSGLRVPFSTNAELFDELSGERFVVGDPQTFEISLSPYSSRILVVGK